MTRARPPRVAVAPPQPGDFCCVPISGYAGLAVEVGQWLDGDRFQPYDHTEIYVGLPDDAGPYGYTVSAYPNRRGKLALPAPAAVLPGSLWSSGLIQLTSLQRDAIVAWCLAHADVGYSWADYAALILHRFGSNDPALQRYIADSAHLICSQYVDLAYFTSEVHLFSDGRWPGYVKPGDLAELLQKALAAR